MSSGFETRVCACAKQRKGLCELMERICHGTHGDAADDACARARELNSAFRVHYYNRLKRVRGGFVPETALYVRLHLLQSVVAYHMGMHEEAQKKLIEATEEHSRLQV